VKKFCTLLFLFWFHIVVFSQNLTDNLTSALNQSMQNKPPDQVFLHLDRNHYHAGDTIRFQAYIRDRMSGIIGSESISLYSLLLNQTHKPIDSARFRIVNFTTSGWLKIPETISSGNYSVLAYTSMMMNYDPECVFSVPVRIDERKTSGLAANQIVEKTGSQPCQISSDQSQIDLRFLPEGGTFVYNVLQRMAFNAVNSSGRILRVRGEIRNQKGEKISEFTSGEFGPGLIEFTPFQGDTLFAFIRGKEFSGMKWLLPVPERSGIAMRVDNNRVGYIDVLLEGKGVKGKAYALVITMNNSLIFSRDVRLDSLFRLSLSTEELPAGTAYVTLYDNGLNPVAERLIFINDHSKMNIEISSSSSVAEAGDETELILNTTDSDGESISSIISVAVVDSAYGFCSTLPFPDIESTFLYDRNFYNNLPPGIKLRGLNNIDKKTVDLLLMTYGWRKFNLKEYTVISPEKKLLDYDYLKISNLEPGRKDKMEVQILTLEDANILTLPVDKDKEAILRYNSLNDSVRRIRILADTKSTKNLISAKIEFPGERSFTDRAKQTQNNDSYDINTSVLAFNDSSATNNSAAGMKEIFHLGEGVINIEEVIIRPKRPPPPPRVYINKYEKLYISSSIKTLTYKQFAAWPSFEYILALFNPYYLDVINKVVVLSLRTSDPALFVLDDIPIGNSYEVIDVLPTSDIASVTVLKGRRGFTQYGSDANGGVVFVTSKTGWEGEYKKNDDLLRPIRLFRTDIEYYIPTKEEVDSIAGLQHRPTILWMNEVILDGSGPVKIRYPDNITKGTALVFVTGISYSNNVGSGRFRYKIK
jgi:hypothetical protein